MSLGSQEIERLLCGSQALGALDALQARDANAWDRSFPPLDALPEPQGQRQPLRICIATEEISGPVRNGGIGTTYAFLAEMLAKQGFATTVLYLRGQDVENGTLDSWIEHYAGLGVTLVPAPNYAAADRAYTGHDRWVRTPYNLMRYLLDHPFDIVHVSEWRGAPYFCLLAKRQGLAFRKTLFLVKASSPWLWNRLYASQPLEKAEDLVKIFAERKCIELADLVICGSAHLLRWMSSQGYRLPEERTFVQPNIVLCNNLASGTKTVEHLRGHRSKVDEIVFFGRLESRKGLFLFCEAMKHLRKLGSAFPAKVTFIGKIGAPLFARQEQSIDAYIKETTSEWPCQISVITDLQQPQALDYLLQGSRLAVMPSIAENSSLAVQEVIVSGIPFLASNAGGTPELVHAADRDRVLCDAHPIPLAAKLQEALETGGFHARPSFDNDQNIESWRVFHERLSRGLLKALLTSTEPGRPNSARPGISVCIYHAKSIASLDKTLRSLAAQEDGTIEIIVGLDVDAAEERDVGRLIEERGYRARIVDCHGCDAGLAYNRIAGEAAHALLLFLWSGSVLHPTAMAALRNTMAASRADVLSFFYRVIQPEGSSERSYLNATVLGSVTDAFARWDLSPMPLLVSAPAFRQSSGFSTDYRVLGCEHEFVARCQLDNLECTTALMEMGSVEAWDADWLKSKRYDEAASNQRMIRPHIAAAPLALREVLLLTKSLAAKDLKRRTWARSPLPDAANGPWHKRGFAKLFMAREATRPARPAGVAPAAQDQAQDQSAASVAALRKQLHSFASQDGTSEYAGRLLGVNDAALVGWVRSRNDFDAHVELEILVDGRAKARCLANEDLECSLHLPRDLRGHAFTARLPRRVRGLFGRSANVVVRVAGNEAILADVYIGGHIEKCGYDGFCDIVHPGVLTGWAWQKGEPESNVDVAVFVDGRFLARLVCSRQRDDLSAAGIGYGAHGFEMALPAALRDGRKRVVTVTIADTGSLLKRGRLLLEGDVLRPL